MSKLSKMNSANSKPHEHEFSGTITFKKGISFSSVKDIMNPLCLARKINVESLFQGYGVGFGGSISFTPDVYEPDPIPGFAGVKNPCFIAGFDFKSSGMADESLLLAIDEMMLRAGEYCRISELTYVNHDLSCAGVPDFKLAAGSEQDLLEWNNKDRLWEIKKELEAMGFDGAVTILCHQPSKPNAFNGLESFSR